MYCQQCGKPTPVGARFCPSCGCRASNSDQTELSSPTRSSHLKSVLKPFLVYPPNLALFMGFIGWLLDKPREEVIAVASSAFVFGLLVATIAAVFNYFRRR
ncbi:hypothetical protein FQZ97_1091600 [compost metagenome]